MAKQKTNAQYEAEHKEYLRKIKEAETAKKKKSLETLPKDFKLADLSYPKYDPKNPHVATLELYNTEGFGWCVTTLLIKSAGRGRQSTDRFYAARLSDEALVRIGSGPHVIDTAIIYVTKNRQAALQKYIDLQKKGAAEAGTVRDRISTRRAQGALRSRYSFF